MERDWQRGEADWWDAWREPEQPAPDYSAVASVVRLMEGDPLLNPWEAQFLADIGWYLADAGYRDRPLSPRQWVKLVAIAAKLDRREAPGGNGPDIARSTARR